MSLEKRVQDLLVGNVVVSLRTPDLKNGNKFAESPDFQDKVEFICDSFRESVVLVFGGSDYSRIKAKNPQKTSFEILSAMKEKGANALSTMIRDKDDLFRRVFVADTKMLIDSNTFFSGLPGAQNVKPVKVVSNFDYPKSLFEEGSESNAFVLCSGLPVYKDSVNAVNKPFEEELLINRDLAASVVAQEVRSKVLILLSEVEGIYDDFKSENRNITPYFNVSTARTFNYVKRGSMRDSIDTKLEAAANFVARDDAAVALITNIDGIKGALEGDLSRVTVVAKSRF